MNARPLRLFLQLLHEPALMLAAVYGGYFYSREYRVIPRALLPLPEFYVGLADTARIAVIFCAAMGVVTLTLALTRGVNRFDDLRRFVTGFFGFLVAFTFASLYLFVATSINYDPQMMAAIGLLGSFLLIGTMSLRLAGLRRFLSSLLSTIGAIFRRFLSVHGILVLLFLCTPLLLAKAFYSNRDVANFITQIRIELSDATSSHWQLVNTFGEQLFHQPMQVRLAPHDDTHLYVLEREGRLLRLPYPDGGEPSVLLDISSKVGEVEVENGTLGFAFHPRFGQTGSAFVYVYYTDVRDGSQFNRVSRFDLAAGSAADVSASEQPLIAVQREPSGFHNGGSVEFGPDGFLYIAFGEGLRTPDYAAPADVLRGGILRIDVDRQGGSVSHPIRRSPKTGTTENYYIPADNPFRGRGDILEEYWALGLRNPFRMSFDAETGRLWAGDVGSTVWEEVNVIEPGKHYQYPHVEGHGTVTGETLIGEQQGPVYAYQHTAFDRAVIGGIVYRGTRHPGLAGRYVFADSYSAKVFSMASDQARVDEVTLLARAEQYAQRGVSSLTALRDGTILVTVLGAASKPGGEILALSRGSSPKAPKADSATPANDATSRTYTAAAAASTFKANCARCHGLDGRGEGPDAESLGVPIPDFTDPAFHASRDAARLREVIEKGGAGTGLNALMPPWEGFLSETDIEFLVRYVQELEEGSNHRYR